VAKVIATKISTGLGNMSNSLTTTLSYNNRSVSFRTGFAIIFNIGIGARLQIKINSKSKAGSF